MPEGVLRGGLHRSLSAQALLTLCETRSDRLEPTGGGTDIYSSSYDHLSIAVFGSTYCGGH